MGAIVLLIARVAILRIVRVRVLLTEGKLATANSLATRVVVFTTLYIAVPSIVDIMVLASTFLRYLVTF